jgi:predicted DNA-binding protein (UPF0251 family)
MDYKQMIRSLGTEQEAAKRLGVAHSTVWRLLHKGAKPSHDLFMALLREQEVEVAKGKKR